jgi:hypothetical protein
MLRRLILSFALAVMFAFGQQGAAVHEISHYADLAPSQQQQDKAPHTSACDQCLSYGKLTSAVGVCSFQPPSLAGDFALHAIEHASHDSLTQLHYAARAPPFLA